MSYMSPVGWFPLCSLFPHRLFPLEIGLFFSCLLFEFLRFKRADDLSLLDGEVGCWQVVFIRSVAATFLQSFIFLVEGDTRSISPLCCGTPRTRFWRARFPDARPFWRPSQDTPPPKHFRMSPATPDYATAKFGARPSMRRRDRTSTCPFSRQSRPLMTKDKHFSCRSAVLPTPQTHPLAPSLVALTL